MTTTLITGANDGLGYEPRRLLAVKWASAHPPWRVNAADPGFTATICGRMPRPACGLEVTSGSWAPEHSQARGGLASPAHTERRLARRSAASAIVASRLQKANRTSVGAAVLSS
jgi:hypothetical protein